MCAPDSWLTPLPERADHYRAQQLGTTQEKYESWLAGNREPEVERAMLEETDRKRLSGNA